MEESFEPSDCILMRSSVLLNFWGVLIQSKMHDKAAKKLSWRNDAAAALEFEAFSLVSN